jgi:hypothetical protein
VQTFSWSAATGSVRNVSSSSRPWKSKSWRGFVSGCSFSTAYSSRSAGPHAERRIGDVQADADVEPADARRGIVVTRGVVVDAADVARAARGPVGRRAGELGQAVGERRAAARRRGERRRREEQTEERASDHAMNGTCERAAEDRRGVAVQPPVDDGRVHAAEVRVVGEVPAAVEEAGVERRDPAEDVAAAGRGDDAVPDHEQRRRGPVVGAGVRDAAVLVQAPAELGERHDEDLVGDAERHHVVVERLHGLGDLRQQVGLSPGERALVRVRVEAADADVEEAGARRRGRRRHRVVVPDHRGHLLEPPREPARDVQFDAQLVLTSAQSSILPGTSPETPIELHAGRARGPSA